MKYDVFISYSRKDTPVADRICQALDRAGISYFIDRRGIGGGAEFPVVLAQAIVDSQLFLFLASNHSYESKFTRKEITFAFNKKSDNSMLPYIIDNSTLPIDLEFVFSSINWRTMREHPIDTVLVNDLLRLLGRPSQGGNRPISSYYLSAQDLSAMADKLYDKKDYARALQLYQEAVNKGTHYKYRAFDAYRIAWMYKNGKGTTESDTESLRWYRVAADLGNATAQCCLGYIYDTGEGVDQDYAEAKKWYLKAAEQGDRTAQYNMGIMCEYGQGMEPDYIWAAYWYGKAAEQGHEKARQARDKLKQKGWA